MQEHCDDHMGCITQIKENEICIKHLKKSDTEQWEKLEKMDEKFDSILKRANHILLVLVLFLLGTVANLGYMALKG